MRGGGDIRAPRCLQPSSPAFPREPSAHKRLPGGARRPHGPSIAGQRRGAPESCTLPGPAGPEPVPRESSPASAVRPPAPPRRGSESRCRRGSGLAWHPGERAAATGARPSRKFALNESPGPQRAAPAGFRGEARGSLPAPKPPSPPPARAGAGGSPLAAPLAAKGSSAGPGERVRVPGPAPGAVGAGKGADPGGTRAQHAAGALASPAGCLAPAGCQRPEQPGQSSRGRRGGECRGARAALAPRTGPGRAAQGRALGSSSDCRRAGGLRLQPWLSGLLLPCPRGELCFSPCLCRAAACPWPVPRAATPSRAADRRGPPRCGASAAPFRCGHGQPREVAARAGASPAPLPTRRAAPPARAPSVPGCRGVRGCYSPSVRFVRHSWQSPRGLQQVLPRRPPPCRSLTTCFVF